MTVKYCYRCGHKFADGEGYQLMYNELTNKLVPVCRDDIACEWQRPGRAAKPVVKNWRK